MYVNKQIPGWEDRMAVIELLQKMMDVGLQKDREVPQEYAVV